MLGPVALDVIDSYDGRDGVLEVRLLGIPVQRHRGSDLALGEAFRYLAKIAWVPQAIVANRELEWQGLDERSAEAATWVAGERIAVAGSVSKATIRNSTASGCSRAPKCAGNCPPGHTCRPSSQRRDLCRDSDETYVATHCK